jgi:hypothetical protein
MKPAAWLPTPAHASAASLLAPPEAGPRNAAYELVTGMHRANSEVLPRLSVAVPVMN